MDLQNNWHKFSKLFQPAPAKKRGIFALTHQDRIIHGAISHSVEPGTRAFHDRGLATEDINSAFDTLSDRYQIKSLALVTRDELLRLLLEMPLLKSETGTDRLYHSQIAHLRMALGIDSSRKAAGLESRGERPVHQYFPRFHFLLQFFRSWLADLLPERRILFVGICDEENSQFESLILEYDGRKIARVIDPDFGTFDWRSLTKGFVKREGAERIVAWCESKYHLPAYTVFLTRRVWDECQKLHSASGSRAAWKFLLKSMRGGNLKQEVLVEPYAWPIRIAAYWNAFRN